MVHIEGDRSLVELDDQANITRLADGRLSVIPVGSCTYWEVDGEPAEIGEVAPASDGKSITLALRSGDRSSQISISCDDAIYI